LAALHAYNLAHPRRRIPTGQFFLDLAYLFAGDRTTYEQRTLAARQLATDMLKAVFETQHVSILVSISNCHSPWYATAGFPAVSVPLGLRQNRMPVGVTLIGQHGTDADLLAYAYAFEQTTRLYVKADIC
jgi:amidase